jgi:hypothetical protein
MKEPPGHALPDLSQPLVRGNCYLLRRTQMIGDLFDSPWKILIVAR